MPASNINRRKFISQTARVMAGISLLPGASLSNDKRIMTVNGWINASQLGFTLTHEHVLVDFIGADNVSPSRYDAGEVFNTALPKLLAVKERGCRSIMECTPSWLGRDPKLLQRLSDASGLQLLTNTGYYGAAAEKYLPAHAFTETAPQLAARWTDEWKNGIDGTGIKPGFIKIGVDKYPFTPAQRKIIEAAAITHLSTGLSICIHTGDGLAAQAEMQILGEQGVSPRAWIWVHAQSEKNREWHLRVAKAGGWVSYDGVNAGSLTECLAFLRDMKKEGLLENVLLSQDSGWYHVGEPGGGNYQDYNAVADKLVPAMKQPGFSEKDIELLFIGNPGRAFSVEIKKK